MEKLLIELRTEGENLHKGFTEKIEERCLKYMKGLGKEFETIIKTKIQQRGIEVYLGESYSDRFEIVREEKWDRTAEEEKYQDATLRFGSTSKATEKELIEIIMVGELAKLKLTKHRYWDTLVEFMNEYHEYYKTNLKPIYDKISKIEANIRDGEKQDRDKKVLDILNIQGFIESDKSMRFDTGPGRYDRVIAKKFSWNINPSGKTCNMFYYNKKRVRDPENQFWVDGEEFDETPIEVGKRVKITDLMSFIRSNIKD